MAEALHPVTDALRTGLAAGPPAPGAEVAAALAGSLLPEEGSPGDPPAWLLPGQHRSWRRALAALRRHGGALLADPVGSGKSYVALAVAATLAGRRAAACLVPAPLVPQWRRLAAALGVPAEVGSHQQASRGRLPLGTAGLVIIDESQHFRHPGTRRYRTVAPWLVGRPVLLLSATPAVNRLDDLAHQLLLGIRDDALLADGVPSLRALLTSGIAAPALGALVIEEPRAAGARPARSYNRSLPEAREQAGAARTVAALEGLRLSRRPPIAALIRGVLHRAAASSPEALAGALRRYRSLLMHARDARAAGRSLSRLELRAFAGELDDQLVLWALLDEGGDSDLALEDLERLDEVAGALAAGHDSGTGDPKLERLRALVVDHRPTVVFACRRETVRHLRQGLEPPAVAWCTGERAGLGRAPVPRATVLSWFGEVPHVPGWEAPRCLVVTDVAAEGLDLRRAERVVHYDLPWTPMRLEQREGRAVRLGSAHERIEVVRFVPPVALEAALRTEQRLAWKAALPARAGLGAEGRRLWRWRVELADEVRERRGTAGTALVHADPEGVLAGFELHAHGGSGPVRLSATVGWLSPAGEWSEAPEAVAAGLRAAAGAESAPAPQEQVRRALDLLAPVIRARLAITTSRRWSAAEPAPEARALAVRLQDRIRAAARARDAAALARLERMLWFVAGGHTAGEALLVRRLSEEPLVPRVELPAPTRRWDAVAVRITGLVLFAGRAGR